jgi:hypothetical protein
VARRPAVLRSAQKLVFFLSYFNELRDPRQDHGLSRDGAAQTVRSVGRKDDVKLGDHIGNRICQLSVPS